jgi:uncharacterized membrane protein HdeD (DUF308 family)
MSASGAASPPSGVTPKSAATILIVECVVLAILGVGALFAPVLAGLAAAIFIGWILIASGIMGVIAAFTTKPHVHFWWSLCSGVVAIIAGLVSLWLPGAAIFGLTLVIAAWLAVDGINSIMAALHLRKAHGGSAFWLVAVAIIDWLLAVFLLSLSLIGAAVAIGVIVGVDLLFGGAALIAMGVSLRRKAT